MLRQSTVLVIAGMLAALCVPPAPGQQAATPRRVALLVGIGEYDKRGFVTLRQTENDADGLAAELNRLGFDKVVVLKGSSPGALRATARNIIDQLQALLKGVDKNDVVLVALSGHGEQVAIRQPNGEFVEEDFFCPVEAVDGDPATLLKVATLTDDILRTRGGRNLLLIDACRDNPTEKRNKGGRGGSGSGRFKGIQGRDLTLPRNTAILFSCAEGQQSLERDDLKHSVFSLSVIEALRAGRTSWFSLADYVQKRVPEQNPAQTPIATGSIGLVDLAPLGGRGPLVADAGTHPGQERDDNALKMRFCWCPSGSFTMGSPPDEPGRYPNEDRLGVTLSQGFWLGKSEVTQAQWKQVMGTSLADQRSKASFSDLYGEGPDYPIYFVNHTEAEEFGRRLTASERSAGRLPAGWEYRLPTEAEWEYACRAGTTTATAFGAGLGGMEANVDGRYPYNGAPVGPSLGSSAPVGGYPPNAWGLNDMHGNVWEWCRDRYTEKIGGAIVVPRLKKAPDRVIRGGGWSSSAQFARSASRNGNAPEDRNPYLGFRLARARSGP